MPEEAWRATGDEREDDLPILHEVRVEADAVAVAREQRDVRQVALLEGGARGARVGPREPRPRARAVAEHLLAARVRGGRAEHRQGAHRHRRPPGHVFHQGASPSEFTQIV